MPKRLRNALRELDGWKPWWKYPLDWVLPLPGPVELGRSKHPALPSRDLGYHPPDAYTWEDWHVEVKRDYPFAYFLRQNFPKPFRRMRRRIEDAWYWGKCHLLPSYRFHTLDMRNPGGGVEYTHGWVDRSEMMLWVCFKLLVEFVEKEDGLHYLREHSAEDLAAQPEPDDEGSQAQQLQVKVLEELRTLYDWWKTGRSEADARADGFYAAKQGAKTQAERDRLTEQWLAARQQCEADDQIRLLQLIALRKHLWT